MSWVGAGQVVDLLGGDCLGGFALCVSDHLIAACCPSPHPQHTFYVLPAGIGAATASKAANVSECASACYANSTCDAFVYCPADTTGGCGRGVLVVVGALVRVAALPQQCRKHAATACACSHIVRPPSPTPPVLLSTCTSHVSSPCPCSALACLSPQVRCPGLQLQRADHCGCRRLRAAKRCQLGADCVPQNRL